MKDYSQISESIDKFLWRPRIRNRILRIVISLIRLIYKMFQEFQEGQITVRAASLVYTTILSLVPFLALAFSVLKAFGVHNIIQPFLYRFLEPFGEQGEDLAISIISFVEKINVAVLGVVGLFFLLYTVISSVKQVESAFNYIWQVTQERSLVRKFRDYFSVILIGPVLIVSAFGITAAVISSSASRKLQSIAPIGAVIMTAGEFAPYVLVILAFTVVYYLLPHTKVRVLSALVGGVAAGLLWQAGGWAFASFVVVSSNYPAIYSGFAIILFFMIWVYYNWIILLIGSKIAFYHQYPDLLSMKDERLLYAYRIKQKAALGIMFLIGQSFYQNKRRWSVDSLVSRLRLPVKFIQDIIDTLVERSVIVQASDGLSYLPAVDLEKIRLSEIISAVRLQDEKEGILGNIEVLPEIDSFLATADKAAYESIEKETLKDLVLAAEQKKNV